VDFGVSFTTTFSSCGFTSSASVIGDDADLNLCKCVFSNCANVAGMRMISEDQIMLSIASYIDILRCALIIRLSLYKLQKNCYDCDVM